MKWEKVSLRDYTTKIGSGVTPKGGASVYQDNGVALFRSQNIYNGSFFDKGLAFINEVIAEKMKSVEVLEGDVLLNITGDSVARCCYAPVNLLPGRVNQHVAIVRADKEKLHSKFLMYQLISPFMQNTMLSYAEGAGATRNALTKGIIEDLKINLPPLPTQRKIASILSAYDDLIENNLKRIKLLEEKAQLHYKELMRDSAKWDKVRLEEFVSVVKGRKPANVLEQPEEESQLYLLLDTVERGKTFYTTDLSLPQSKITDVLMCMDGARSGLSFRGIVGAIGSTMAIWRSNSDRVSGEFLYQFMKQNESAITQGNTGAAIPHANRKFILDMKITMPPKKEAEYFDSITLPMIKLINTLHNQNAKLREARDILLPKLMNGQIEV